MFYQASLKIASLYADKPEDIILDWEHSVNRVGAVSANQEYKATLPPPTDITRME